MLKLFKSYLAGCTQIVRTGVPYEELPTTTCDTQGSALRLLLFLVF